MPNTHGLYKSPVYGIWKNMKKRCYNPKATSYSSYGGKGVTVCDEWKNDFKKFHDWAFSNGYEEGLTLDRIEVSGNYEPCNCRWLTKVEQNYNTTRSHFIEYNGKKQTITEWAKELGFELKTLSDRLKKGMSVENAFTTPLKYKRKWN